MSFSDIYCFIVFAEMTELPGQLYPNRERSIQKQSLVR